MCDWFATVIGYKGTFTFIMLWEIKLFLPSKRELTSWRNRWAHFVEAWTANQRIAGLIPGPATLLVWDWSLIPFLSDSPPTSDSSRAVVSYYWYVHLVLVKHLTQEEYKFVNWPPLYVLNYCWNLWISPTKQNKQTWRKKQKKVWAILIFSSGYCFKQNIVNILVIQIVVETKMTSTNGLQKMLLPDLSCL